MCIRLSRNRPLPWPELLRRRAVLCTLHLLSSWRSPGSLGHSTLYSTPRTVKGTRIAAKSSMLETIRIQLRFLAFPDLLKGSTVILYVDSRSVIHGWRRQIWRMTLKLQWSFVLFILPILQSVCRTRPKNVHPDCNPGRPPCPYRKKK